MKGLFFSILLIALFFVGCGDSKQKQDSEQSSTSSTRDVKVDSQPSLGASLESANTESSTTSPQDSNSPALEDSQPTKADVTADSSPAMQNPAPSNVASDPETLYRKCASCHGKDGKSVAPGSTGALIASLDKNQVTELLKGFRSQSISRGGNSIIMYMQAKNLSDADIEALAGYIDAF